ncbi:MAG TPA: hypothetical protein VHK01_17940 [Lacipirellulaceae bacterium]|jgi:hypothetical protein|nr:hypothetical protein [Lacipirellulaceae bacterium]
MRNSISTIVGLLAWHLAITCEGAEELRTYRFVVDGSLPYFASCGECVWPYAGARADIEGIFILSLDRGLELARSCRSTTGS